MGTAVLPYGDTGEPYGDSSAALWGHGDTNAALWGQQRYPMGTSVLPYGDVGT